ncbi:phosphotransferase enzyme family protein [Annulohypoxylon maeteangense]|uniref:phosphotransferase enzyme family protein n=1 Tax=Annulohypoxylon maeteangense TaxID=1927788 RepID=UPI002007C178|nr:phosphotransferase enzyme family protein [Annulohypoxylon maeteangense]KAI0886893.1 phosphotransferase enzyme family protein [Annulohypoxylon maeteangense]
MFNNGLIDLHRQVQAQLWVDKINKAHETSQLCPWVSTFHPKRLTCKLEGGFYHGSFNAGMVRFPRVGKVHNEYIDEKTAMEVRALSLIRERTTIPIPKVQAWGYAAENPLGLGAFIMMDFVNGVCLNDLLIETDKADPTRLLREDISDGDIEVIYRQFANFLLQLFSLDYDSIGNLPSPEDKPESLMPKRPLTYKAHDILHNGGVDVFGGRCQGFATVTEYFQYLLEQDFGQLNHQPNSIYGPNDARRRYLSLKVLESLLPDLINKNYDGGKFELICDDLGLANLIYLNIYKRVLEEEEAKMPGHEKRELSNLVKWSQESGLHMLMSVGFNDQDSFPFMQLHQHVGEKEWKRREVEFRTLPEVEAFVTQKTITLEKYEVAMGKLKSEKVLVDAGQMTHEAFLATSIRLG